ncbi:hypothetical protein Q8A73_006090 [Channa argus]|nr:hypothetical protein Q8A73_006090 [Channa argus]
MVQRQDFYPETFWVKLGCPFKSLPVSVSALRARCQITHRAPGCYQTATTPTHPPPNTPPCSQLSMVRSRSLVLRFIPASLAGAQSELQPGNRAHAEPQCLLAARSPPLASVSLIVFNHPPPPSPLPPHPALPENDRCCELCGLVAQWVEHHGGVPKTAGSDPGPCARCILRQDGD